MEKLNEVAAFLDRNPGLADCVVQITYSEMYDIAEAFRALEQRAEAAEAERSALQDGFAEAIRHKDRLADELNELAKQEPAGHFMLARDEDDSWWHEASEHNDNAIPLFTRPAPAADLAKLVPIRAPIEVISIIENSVNGPVYDEGAQAIWSGCIEYMLRNIEEAR